MGPGPPHVFSRTRVKPYEGPPTIFGGKGRGPPTLRNVTTSLQIDAAIIKERLLLVHFHSSSLTSTFNPKARSAWGPTLIT